MEKSCASGWLQAMAKAWAPIIDTWGPGAPLLGVDLVGIGVRVRVGVGVGVEAPFCLLAPPFATWGPRAPPRGANLVGGGLGNEGGGRGVMGVDGDMGGSSSVVTSCDRLRRGATGRSLVLDVRWRTESKGKFLP